jgi:hypothetical protein
MMTNMAGMPELSDEKPGINIPFSAYKEYSYIQNVTPNLRALRHKVVFDNKKPLDMRSVLMATAF